MARTVRLAFGFIVLLVLVSLVGCAALTAPAPAAAPAAGEVAAGEQLPAAEEAESAPEEAAESAPEEAAYEAESSAGQETAAAASEAEDVGALAPAVNGDNRMIVKNGEMRLSVADTNVAVERITQIAADLGGYILSSRGWSQDGPASGGPHHFASITLSVPADQFETALNRLRGLAVRVLEETASGEDVTNQFVDLESQLKNNQATRDRIRGFLDKAQTVEEALKVNEQLAVVEAEIEKIQGRMKYLEGRSAYSTIAVNVEPELPTPTPSPTPTATPSPTPTSMPEAWSPGRTFGKASSTLQVGLQSFADGLIWIGVVILPFALLALLVAWLIWRFWSRSRKADAGQP